MPCFVCFVFGLKKPSPLKNIQNFKICKKTQCESSQNFKIFKKAKFVTLLLEYTTLDVALCQARAYARGGEVGVKKPLQLDILQKVHYLRKGDSLVSHTFCLLICRLNANTME